MYRDNSNTNVNPRKPSPHTLYRGLYVRIARKVGVDASYVSRVARGDRRSSEIESALREALEEIDQQLGRGSLAGRSGASQSASSAKRLQVLIKQNRERIQKQWLTHSQADPQLTRVRIATKKRIAPIAPLLEETVKVMKFSVKEMASIPMKAAEQIRKPSIIL